MGRLDGKVAAITGASSGIGEATALALARAGAAVALGAAAKFVNLALAPLFARRAPLVFAGTLVLLLVATVAPFVPDGGLRELYDRTVGYQASRPSPFSVWGQVESLDWLQTVVKGAAVALGVLAAFLPRRRDPRQLAAMGAAILITVELAATHWFYLYVIWFVPFVFVTVFGAYGRTLPERTSPEHTAAREAVYA
jgi:NAD(P)-dependent dehydrogenase (short-subunit alcohol dehydrogenase family)